MLGDGLLALKGVEAADGVADDATDGVDREESEQSERASGDCTKVAEEKRECEEVAMDGAVAVEKAGEDAVEKLEVGQSTQSTSPDELSRSPFKRE